MLLLVFRLHAIERMSQYEIGVEDVRYVLSGARPSRAIRTIRPIPAVSYSVGAKRDLYTWLPRTTPKAARPS